MVHWMFAMLAVFGGFFVGLASAEFYSQGVILPTFFGLLFCCWLASLPISELEEEKKEAKYRLLKSKEQTLEELQYIRNAINMWCADSGGELATLDRELKKLSEEQK